ncbi:MarR family transcriptional regulator [Methanoculleus sp.]|jgi:predicted transcriptional regulator|uniref:MarR family transcriptional regulator n=1 Tax=Methanoculleus sp. TaxID=90427 RepID=UPI00262BFFBC|nr:MarR family transcriptional regulator [Methanoculleus sp.]MDI6867284.1 ArsR family transcriptional regulator [Methanoculleus sp.]
MGPETTKSFTPRDEEVAELLMDIGIKRNVARVLVFLTNNAEATSREIERGTDLRQPEVSIAMRYLKECDWIDVRESRSESKGRPVKIYNLSRPISEIMDKIEYEKKKEARHQLDLIQKMRECISTQ